MGKKHAFAVLSAQALLCFVALSLGADGAAAAGLREPAAAREFRALDLNKDCLLDLNEYTPSFVRDFVAPLAGACNAANATRDHAGLVQRLSHAMFRSLASRGKSRLSPSQWAPSLRSWSCAPHGTEQKPGGACACDYFAGVGDSASAAPSSGRHLLQDPVLAQRRLLQTSVDISTISATTLTALGQITSALSASQDLQQSMQAQLQKLQAALDRSTALQEARDADGRMTDLISQFQADTVDAFATMQANIDKAVKGIALLQAQSMDETLTNLVRQFHEDVTADLDAIQAKLDKQASAGSGSSAGAGGCAIVSPAAPGRACLCHHDGSGACFARVVECSDPLSPYCQSPDTSIESCLLATGGDCGGYVGA